MLVIRLTSIFVINSSNSKFKASLKFTAQLKFWSKTTKLVMIALCCLHNKLNQMFYQHRRTSNSVALRNASRSLSLRGCAGNRNSWRLWHFSRKYFFRKIICDLAKFDLNCSTGSNLLVGQFFREFQESSSKSVDSDLQSRYLVDEKHLSSTKIS